MASVTAADVHDFLGLDPLDRIDDAWVKAATDAAVDYVSRVRPECDWRNPTASQRLGLIMLAARFYERRGADDQQQNAGYEFSGPIPLIGRQIEQLLGLGRWHEPVIA